VGVFVGYFSNYVIDVSIDVLYTRYGIVIKYDNILIKYYNIKAQTLIYKEEYMAMLD